MVMPPTAKAKYLERRHSELRKLVFAREEAEHLLGRLRHRSSGMDPMAHRYDQILTLCHTQEEVEAVIDELTIYIGNKTAVTNERS